NSLEGIIAIMPYDVSIAVTACSSRVLRWHLFGFGLASHIVEVAPAMNSSPDTIRELEFRRRALNERLMNAKDVVEANGIERELWAVRAQIRYHKAKIAKRGMPRSADTQAPPTQESSGKSEEVNLSG